MIIRVNLFIETAHQSTILVVLVNVHDHCHCRDARSERSWNPVLGSIGTKLNCCKTVQTINTVSTAWRRTTRSSLICDMSVNASRLYCISAWASEYERSVDERRCRLRCRDDVILEVSCVPRPPVEIYF